MGVLVFRFVSSASSLCGMIYLFFSAAGGGEGFGLVLLLVTTAWFSATRSVSVPVEWSGASGCLSIVLSLKGLVCSSVGQEFDI